MNRNLELSGVHLRTVGGQPVIHSKLDQLGSRLVFHVLLSLFQILLQTTKNLPRRRRHPRNKNLPAKPPVPLVLRPCIELTNVAVSLVRTWIQNRIQRKNMLKPFGLIDRIISNNFAKYGALHKKQGTTRRSLTKENRIVVLQSAHHLPLCQKFKQFVLTATKLAHLHNYWRELWENPWMMPSLRTGVNNEKKMRMAWMICFFFVEQVFSVGEAALPHRSMSVFIYRQRAFTTRPEHFRGRNGLRYGEEGHSSVRTTGLVGRGPGTRQW